MIQRASFEMCIRDRVVPASKVYGNYLYERVKGDVNKDKTHGFLLGADYKPVSYTHLEIATSEVRLPNGPIRTLGDHDVRFQLHGEVFATLDVIVVAE